MNRNDRDDAPGIPAGSEFIGEQLPEPIGGQLSLRSLVMISALFWTYVTFSNILYSRSMQITLGANVFAPWSERVFQHVLLFPVLVVCYWTSLRAWWTPIARIAVQVALAVAFASLSYSAMDLAERAYHSLYPPTTPVALQEPAAQGALWVAYFTTFLLTYGFGLGVVTAVALYQRFHYARLRIATLQREWSVARLSALRMQLSPHTLFNLLHAIRGQVAWDPEVAEEMIVQFADLLRRLLSAGQRDFCSLCEELRFADSYLQLQRQRFCDRLNVMVPDPDAQPALWVPSLILQPLIENAVVHGLAGHEGRVDIRVEVSPSAEGLKLRVVNTRALDGGQQPAGIGLSNVRERLRVQFGTQAELTFGPLDGSTWVAELRMPLLRELTTRYGKAREVPR